MHLSKSGIWFAVIYNAINIIIYITSFILDDHKARFVVKQIGVLPASIFMEYSGIGVVFFENKFVNNFLSFAVISTIIMYAIGWMIGALMIFFMKINRGNSP